MTATRADTSFRQDINGMRALAVIGVIAFHLKLGPLRAGGFAGVDIFFVISGFLMSQIITGRLDRDRFSLLDFLKARVRRIAPAFVAMILGVLVAGHLLFPPLQFEQLAYKAAWTLPFLSNILFASQGTYFVAPEQNWLLHTWSLSVEAQFYLLFPLVLLLAHKACAHRGIACGALTLLALASFAMVIWSLSVGGHAPIWNFFMLWSRAWEFLVGALLAYAITRVRFGPAYRHILHYGGLIASILAMLIFRSTTPWPSAATLLPVAGAAAILLAGHTDPYWARTAPIRHIGFWSYSIYLWHWPIAAALLSFGNWSLSSRLAGISASLLLGAASYYVIEKRVTAYAWTKPSRLAWISAVSLLAFVGLELVSRQPNIEEIAQLNEYRAAQRDVLTEGTCDVEIKSSRSITECKFGDVRAHEVLVVGDSFAGELIARYKDGIPAKLKGITFVVRPGCALIPDTETINSALQCSDWRDDAIHFIEQSSFNRIVFINFWSYYRQGVLCLVTEPECGSELASRDYAEALDAAYRRLGVWWRKLAKDRHEVVVFGPVPVPGVDASTVYNNVAAGGRKRDMDIDYQTFMTEQRDTIRRLRDATGFSGAVLVDPALTLCPGGKCPIVQNGHPLYADSSHFRASLMTDARFRIYDKFILQ